MENKENDQMDSVIRSEANIFFFLLKDGSYDISNLHFNSLFKLILYSISRFGIEGELDNLNFPLKEDWKILHKSYSGDSTLFEVGCFLYFLIEQWFRGKKPEWYYERLFNYLLTKFVWKFNKIYKFGNSRDFYKQRYSKYLEIAEEGGNIEDYYFYLQQLIFLTKESTQLKEHDFERVNIVPFTHSFWIKAKFFAWYVGMVPQTYKFIEMFITQNPPKNC